MGSCASLKMDNPDIKNFIPSAFKSEKSEFRPGPAPTSERYKMDHRRRGLALIFNHKNFDGSTHCSVRNGTDKDRDDLKEVLEVLKFSVRCYEDYSVYQVKETILKVSRENHDDADCLVVIILTHGKEEGKIFARDGSYPVKLLWANFDGKKCPGLRGKPKLFFLQACRGSNQDKGVQMNYLETDSLKEAKATQIYSIPTEADILIMYSTSEDHVSWRSETNGTYFIQSLVRQLKAYGSTKDLLSILTRVNREIAVGYSEESSCVYQQKQMCSFVSKLTRDLYFF